MKKKQLNYKMIIEYNWKNQSKLQLIYRNEQKRRLEEERNERLVLENEKEQLQNNYKEIIKQIAHETNEERANLQKKLSKD